MELEDEDRDVIVLYHRVNSAGRERLRIFLQSMVVTSPESLPTGGVDPVIQDDDIAVLVLELHHLLPLFLLRRLLLIGLSGLPSLRLGFLLPRRDDLSPYCWATRLLLRLLVLDAL